MTQGGAKAAYEAAFALPWADMLRPLRGDWHVPSPPKLSWTHANRRSALRAATGWFQAPQIVSTAMTVRVVGDLAFFTTLIAVLDYRVVRRLIA